MKLEMFFEKFEQFADAPNAVGKMRELVRTLAIQGKLVPQDPSEESADNLIKRVATGLPKKQSENPFLSVIEPTITDESNYDLPPGWSWLPLGHAGKWATGCGFPKQFQGEMSGEFLFSKVSDMNLPGNEVEINTTVNSIDAAVMQKIRARANPIGTVIFPKIGGAIATHKRRLVIKPTIIDNNCSGIQPIGLTDCKWLMILMRCIDLTRYQSGTSVPAVSQGALDPIRIGLPPLAEQKRIVAKVDELMALCDRLEVQQQERDTHHAALARASLARFAEAPTPANLDFLFHQSYTIPPADLRKSILTLAVQGKLVPQDPNDESSELLFKKIQAERAQLEAKGEYKSVKPLASIDETEESFKLPFEWRWARLRSLAFTLGDGLHGTPEYSDGTGCFFINGNNLVDGRIVIKHHTKTVSLDEAKKHRKPMMLNTVLVSINGTLGSVAFYNNEDVILGKSACYFNLASFVDKHYIRRIIESPYFINYAMENATGSTIRNLGLKAMNHFPVPLPPHAEQRRIVAKVDQLMALVDQLESQLADAKAKSAALLEAIVHELLNPTAEIIDLASYRAAIGCYAINKMSDKPYFGRTAAMKSLYLAEAHVGMKLGFQFEREAAGPLDHWLYRFEHEGKQKAWFKAVENVSNGKMKVEYQPGKLLAEQAAQAESQLAPEQRKEFDRLLDLLSDKKTEEVEIIATLFAVWNDFLIDGHAPSDDKIVTEVRENWHERKERFTPAQLLRWLGWLRKNNLVPQGRLPHTVHQSNLLFS